MPPKIGHLNEIDDDHTSLAEKMGSKEIDNLRPNHKTENVGEFIKKVCNGGNKETDGDIGYLESNTAILPNEMRDGGKYDSYTKEDFEEIWENDPQYVNEKVYRPLPGTSPESIERQKHNPEEVLGNDSRYLMEGLHGDLINWKVDSVPGTEVGVKIPEGTLLKRYGSNEGQYFADVDTKFEALNLPSDRFKASNYLVVKPLPAIKSEIADQPFTMRKPGSPRAVQYKTELSVARLVDEGYLKKLEDGDNVKLGHFNEGIEKKDVHETSREGGEKHLDKKTSLADIIKNGFSKKESGENHDKGGEQKMGLGDKLKVLFDKEKTTEVGKESEKPEKGEKSTREKFLESIKIDKNGDYVNKRENKNANSEGDNQANESLHERLKTNEFRESLKVKVDPNAHLNVKDTFKRDPGGFIRGPKTIFHEERER